MEESIFNNSSETAILSLAITKPALVYSLENVRDYMFSSNPNRVIWNAIKNIVEKSLIPDKEMVLNELKITNRLFDAGTESYVNYIASQVFSEENLQEYQNQLITSYKASGVLSLTSGLADRLLHSANVDEEISSIRQKLDKLQDITNTGISDSLQDIGEEAKQKIIDRTNNPGKVGFTFGLKDVDTFTGGIVPGEVWVIGGRPSMGKTAAALNSVLGSARDQNPCLFFSLETSKQRIVERLIALDEDIPLQDIHLGTLDKKQLKRLTDSIDRLKKLPIYIDTNFTPSLEYLLSNIRRMVKQKGVRIVYIDYIQLLTGRGDDDRKEIGRMCRALKLIANQLDICVVILAQLNRSCESRDDKRPLLSDLKESGDIEQDADMVTFLYRDVYYNKDTKNHDQLEWIIRKYRDGAIGTLMFTMDMSTNRIGTK
jgi:replicative DNA helicase